MLVATVTSKPTGLERGKVMIGKLQQGQVLLGPREPISTDKEPINGEQKLLKFSLLMEDNYTIWLAITGDIYRNTTAVKDFLLIYVLVSV